MSRVTIQTTCVVLCASILYLVSAEVEILKTTLEYNHNNFANQSKTNSSEIENVPEQNSKQIEQDVKPLEHDHSGHQGHDNQHHQHKHHHDQKEHKRPHPHLEQQQQHHHHNQQQQQEHQERPEVEPISNSTKNLPKETETQSGNDLKDVPKPEKQISHLEDNPEPPSGGEHRHAVERDDLITVKKDLHEWDQPNNGPPPPWDPLSTVGKVPATRPPYRVSFTPYTTPTPLPNRPDWKKADWLNYFKTNHPNFWFHNQLKKNYTKEHGIENPEELEPWKNIDQAKTKAGSESEFDYANWKNWGPADWLKWSSSKEYKDNYLNPLNPYLVKEGKMPFKVHEDLNPDDDVVADVRSNAAVFLTLFKNPAAKTTNNLTKVESEDREDATPTESILQAHKFSRPTVSPTKDPHYVYSGSAVRRRNGPLLGLSGEYLIRSDESVTPEQPKSHLNAFEEGRYEFKPSKLRQRNPIIFSDLFQEKSPGNDLMKSSRQTGGASYPKPVDLASILIRSKNFTSDPNPASLGQFSKPTTYADYIANLERLSGVPVIGNLENPTPLDSSATGSALQIRPAGPGRPSAHFSEGYVPPALPFASQPPPPPPSIPDKSSSTSTSTSGGSQSQSAAAASGAGASTSTSTQTGEKVGEKPAIEETENNNVYYPCEEGVDCIEEDQENDYNNDNYDYPTEPDTNQEPVSNDYDDATVVESNDNQPQLDVNKIDEDSAYDYGDFPSFENCNSLEECLGVGQTEEGTNSTDKLGADLMEYYYDSGDTLRPEDSIVSQPVFSPSGDKLLTAANSAASAAANASPDQLDSLINSLSSLVRLLNTTRTQDQSGSYFPGFPTYAVVPGPDTHRVSYRPGPGHISVVSSPFLHNNKVKLKSGNSRKKYPISNGIKEDLVINLYRNSEDDQITNSKSKQVEDRSSNSILKRSERSAARLFDDGYLYFLKNRDQNQKNLQTSRMNGLSNPFVNMESPDRPIFVSPSQLLIKQSISLPQLSGMEFNVPDQFMDNKQEQGTSLEQQQQELFMAQLQQQQLQRQQQQQVRQNQQATVQQPNTQFQLANGYNPQYPPPYLYNPYYPPYNYFQQQQPSGGSSTSTSCSSAGCTAAAAAGSSTSTSTSSGGGAASRENPGKKRISNRQQTTSTTTVTTTRTTRTTTTRTTTTTASTTTTKEELELNSRPNFGQNNTTRVETTTATNTTGGNNNNNNTTRPPFSIRFGKREANRGEEEEEEPYYDYDLPTNQEGYQFQPPDENIQDQYSQEVVPQQLPQGIMISEQPQNPVQPPINYDYLPQVSNQIVPEAQKPVQDPWQPQDPYRRPQAPNQLHPQHQPPPPPPPPPSPQPLTVEMLMNPSKPYQQAIKPFVDSKMPFQQSRKPFQTQNKPAIHPGKAYHPEVKPKYQPGKLQMPPSVPYQKASEAFPIPSESPKQDNDYIITEEPLMLTPETMEAPSSLQTILSSHQVRTNFLKTPPRTEHFGYQTAEHLPTNYQPANMMTMLTPKKEVEHFPSHYQELAEHFYTSSGEVKQRSSRPVSYAEQDPADDRFSEDYEDVGSSKVDEVESKENPLVNTAVIALKLSAKILDFYKTVSPYLPQ